MDGLVTRTKVVATSTANDSVMVFSGILLMCLSSYRIPLLEVGLFHGESTPSIKPTRVICVLDS